jgi:hypothetical protein
MATDPVDRMLDIAKAAWRGWQARQRATEPGPGVPVRTPEPQAPLRLEGLPYLLQLLERHAGRPLELRPFDPVLDLANVTLPLYPLCTPLFPGTADYRVLEGVLRSDRWAVLWAATFPQVQQPARVSVWWTEAHGFRMAGGSEWLDVTPGQMHQAAQVSFAESLIVVDPGCTLSVTSARYERLPAPGTPPPLAIGALPVILHGITGLAGPEAHP